MTQHVNLPIHREYDQAQRALTDVWAALNRASCHNPLATAAELIDQLAAERDRAHDASATAAELIGTLAAQRHRAHDLVELLDLVTLITAAESRAADRDRGDRDQMPAWMTGDDSTPTPRQDSPDQTPATRAGRPTAWYDLPIAAGMWRADAADAHE